MSLEQVQAFLEKIKGDTSLQEKLKTSIDINAVVAFAKEQGFSFSVEDLKNNMSAISEDELAGISGGAGNWFENIFLKPMSEAALAQSEVMSGGAKKIS